MFFALSLLTSCAALPGYSSGPAPFPGAFVVLPSGMRLGVPLKDSGGNLIPSQGPMQYRSVFCPGGESHEYHEWTPPGKSLDNN
jgi:hypothetical protein